MLRKKLVENIWLQLINELSTVGFIKTSGPYAYRDRGSVIDVLKIDFFEGKLYKQWGISNKSFGVSGGIFLKFSPNPFGGDIKEGTDLHLEPDLTVCAIRSFFVRESQNLQGIPQYVWPVSDDGLHVNLIIEELGRTIKSDVKKWFDQFSSIEQIVEFFDQEEEQMAGDAPCFGFGRKGSPVRNLYLGFSAAACGKNDIARKALSDSLSKGGFFQLSGSHHVDEEIKQLLVKLEAGE